MGIISPEKYVGRHNGTVTKIQCKLSILNKEGNQTIKILEYKYKLLQNGFLSVAIIAEPLVPM